MLPRDGYDVRSCDVASPVQLQMLGFQPMVSETETGDHQAQTEHIPSFQNFTSWSQGHEGWLHPTDLNPVISTGTNYGPGMEPPPAGFSRSDPTFLRDSANLMISEKQRRHSNPTEPQDDHTENSQYDPCPHLFLRS